MAGRFVRLLPLLLPYAALFVGGLAMTFLQSVGLFPFAAENLSFHEYQVLATDVSAAQSFGFSCYVAFTSAMASVLTGTAMSYFIWKYRLTRTALISKIGLILPHVSVAFLVLLVFGQTGVLASICHHAGLINTPDEFPRLLFDGNGLGMILAYLFKGSAFTVLMVSAVLFGFDFRMIQTARMLGAGPTRIFLRITLPRMLPAMHSAFIILFLYAFGAFDIPFLLGESHPGMLAIRVYNIYFQRDLADRPQAMAILSIMFLCSMLFIMLYNRLAPRLGSGRKL